MYFKSVPDGTVVAEHPNLAVPPSILQETSNWIVQGASLEDTVKVYQHDRHRIDIVSRGNTHWHSKNLTWLHTKSLAIATHCTQSGIALRLFPLIWSQVKSTAHQMFPSTMYAHMPNLVPLYSYQDYNQDFPFPSLLDNLWWRTEKLVDKVEKSDITTSFRTCYLFTLHNFCGSQGMCLLVSSYYCNVVLCFICTGSQQWMCWTNSTSANSH